MNDQEIIDQIGYIRHRNNDLWMRLLAIAVEEAPTEAKNVLREITTNDRAISDLIGSLAK